MVADPAFTIITRRNPGVQVLADLRSAAGVKAAVGADIDKMVKSAAWQKILADKGWANTYLAGADFNAQLKKDVDATAAILKEIGLVK